MKFLVFVALYVGLTQALFDTGLVLQKCGEGVALTTKFLQNIPPCLFQIRKTQESSSVSCPAKVSPDDDLSNECFDEEEKEENLNVENIWSKAKEMHGQGLTMDHVKNALPVAVNFLRSASFDQKLEVGNCLLHKVIPYFGNFVGEIWHTAKPICIETVFKEIIDPMVKFLPKNPASYSWSF